MGKDEEAATLRQDTTVPLEVLAQWDKEHAEIAKKLGIKLNQKE